MRHLAWLNAIPDGQKENPKPRRDLVSEAHRELVDLDEYEQHLVKLWREVGSVSQGGMGVAPLAWEAILQWADKFYTTEKILYVPRTIEKKIEKIVRGKPKVETETILEQVPIVIKNCSLEDYELEIVMQLSREYCSEYHEASNAGKECPKEIFLDEVDAEENADEILKGLKAMFGGDEQNQKPEIVNNY